MRTAIILSGLVGGETTEISPRSIDRFESFAALLIVTIANADQARLVKLHELSGSFLTGF